jgi:hypothetical protein
MRHFARPIAVLVCALAFSLGARAAEVVVHFDREEAGKPVPAYTNQGVVFSPAHAATRSAAVPRVMFFPHLKTDKKGILNAMADDPIPVKVQFPAGASSVTLVFWGSTGCPALVQAFDQDGKVVDQATLAAVPDRSSPADPVPSFELTVKAPAIAWLCFSGPRLGEYLAAEELRFSPLVSTNLPATAAGTN